MKISKNTGYALFKICYFPFYNYFLYYYFTAYRIFVPKQYKYLKIFYEKNNSVVLANIQILEDEETLENEQKYHETTVSKDNVDMDKLIKFRKLVMKYPICFKQQSNG